MAFNENLQRARKAKGLNQQELAEQIGLSRQAVSKWEIGDSLPDLYKLSALADALDVSMDTLCDREVPDREIIANNSKQHRSPVNWKTIIAAVALIAAGFLTGFFLARNKVPESISEMPDLVTAGGVQFANQGETLYFEFVPSVTGSDYVYQLSFSGGELGQSTVDAACTGGICTGTASLLPGISYTVSAVVSDGTQSRVICIATDLTLDTSNGVSWSPC